MKRLLIEDHWNWFIMGVRKREVDVDIAISSVIVNNRNIS
jgi:hypothetical protein